MLKKINLNEVFSIVFEYKYVFVHYMLVIHVYALFL
jgi:hypothetical protein